MTEFDFKEALEGLQSGKNLTGKDGVLTPLIKQLTEAALEGEMEHHLRESGGTTRRNGRTTK